MTRIAAILLTVAGTAFLAEQPATIAYPIRPVPLAQVQITGGFWRPRLDTNRLVTIPHILQQNETTGRVDNLRKGAGRLPGEYQGRRFNDTDVYKVIEAAAYTLVSHPDPELSKKLDELIELIAASQQPDGYLFPARTINPAKPAAGLGNERWMHENTGSHELYNFGHLYEAAIAHFAATGKRSLLDVAVKNANLVRRTFGPAARRDAPGHEEIELALVRLFQTTNDRRYLDLARFFMGERGKPHASKDYPADSNFAIYNDRPYRQDHLPVVDQPRAVGHAVRATYLYAAMTDIAGMLGDRAYDAAVNRLWDDVAFKRMYVTGGLGARGTVEAFGDDYELPNRTAYTETCASIGGLLWHHRMFLKSGDTKYLDAFEQTLYNGYLSGVSIKGDTFFYQNPLESTGRNERSAYFDVACCPANLARLMARLPELVYAQRGDEIFVNLYAESTAAVKLPQGQVRIEQATRYPWDGRVTLSMQLATPMEFTLRLRAPGWLGEAPIASDLYRFANRTEDVPVTVDVSGRRASAQIDRGWITLRRQWISGDRVELTLPMPARRVLAHAGIKDNIGKAALQRGPIVYSLEGLDNGGRVVDAVIPLTAPFTPVFQGELMGGVTVLRADLRAAAIPMAATRIYTAVPYFAWANRGRGEMIVWIRY
ncbi:MAG TPA: beta-L-arabinofuranosidase domain-containing protein [Vicinamibacterales bacterium]|nr:beta-L-arabinofuranosidase domain-containing protein [Vicinamibacterales bacterium]